ncbi:MAG: hypothetical protein IPQ07_39530 [Myxococcales bacterium]|nr:hypothetical protein [Myxococcales bacterium]
MTSRFVVGALNVLIVVGCGSSASTGDDGAGPDATAAVDGGVDAPPGVWSPEPACASTADGIYAATAAGGARGSVAACALGAVLTQAQTQAAMAGDGAEGVTAQTGARVVKLAYRTIRSDGTAAVTTATAYLPLVPRTVPAQIVLIGRPTSGLADSCAPSKDEMPEKNLALPFAARGFIAITPDYAGLGNAGTHAYLDTHEEVTQLFDGVLALRAMLPGNIVGEAVAAVGYSQGGGIVLGAQALEHALTGKHTLKAVAAIAPEWPISTRSFGYEDILRNPNGLTGLAGLSSPTVAVLRHYGFMANRMGAAAAGDAFPAGERSELVSSIEGLCTVPLGGALNAQQIHLRDLVDETFRLAVLACIDGTAGCAGAGKQFHDWMVGDFVTADAAGARVLITQGLADQVMPAAGEAACDVAKLRAEGVQPDLCTDALSTHDTVLERKIEDVVAWTEAVITGATPPVCSSQTLPACNR